jgi:hypothetical protein
MSPGKVTSNGSLRGSNGSFKVTGRAISPCFDAENLWIAKLKSALDVSVTATGSWNDGMPPNRDQCTEGAWGLFCELSSSEQGRRGRERMDGGCAGVMGSNSSDQSTIPLPFHCNGVSIGHVSVLFGSD